MSVTAKKKKEKKKKKKLLAGGWVFMNHFLIDLPCSGNFCETWSDCSRTLHYFLLSSAFAHISQGFKESHSFSHRFLNVSK